MTSNVEIAHVRTFKNYNLVVSSDSVIDKSGYFWFSLNIVYDTTAFILKQRSLLWFKLKCVVAPHSNFFAFCAIVYSDHD